MHRTQIQLEDRQYEHLKTIAEREGKSLSQLVREAVSTLIRERRLRSRRAKVRLTDIEGIGEDSGARGRDHDQLLYAASEKGS